MKLRSCQMGCPTHKLRSNEAFMSRVACITAKLPKAVDQECTKATRDGCRTSATRVDFRNRVSLHVESVPIVENTSWCKNPGHREPGRRRSQNLSSVGRTRKNSWNVENSNAGTKIPVLQSQIKSSSRAEFAVTYWLKPLWDVPPI